MERAGDLWNVGPTHSFIFETVSSFIGTYNGKNTFACSNGYKVSVKKLQGIENVSMTIYCYYDVLVDLTLQDFQCKRTSYYVLLNFRRCVTCVIKQYIPTWGASTNQSHNAKELNEEIRNLEIHFPCDPPIRAMSYIWVKHGVLTLYIFHPIIKK